MTDAKAIETKLTPSETLQNCELLAEVICRAVEATAKAPPTISAPDRPLPLYRDMAARHRAGAVGVLLGAAHSPLLRAMGKNLNILAGDSPLATATFANAETATRAASNELAVAREALIATTREHVAGVNPRRLVLDGTNLLQLGDIEGAKLKLAALSGAEPQFRMTLRMRILDAEGFIADSERLAIQIRRTHPDMLPQYAGVAADYRRVGAVELSPPDEGNMKPSALNAYLRYLILNDKPQEAAAYALRHVELIPQQLALTARAATVVLANMGHTSELWGLVRATAEKLPIAAKAVFMAVTAEVTPKRLAQLLEEAAPVAEDTACTTWQQLISRAYLLAEPVPTDTLAAQTALNALLALCGEPGGESRADLTSYATEADYVIADERNDPSIFNSRAMANAPADHPLASARQILTPKAIAFLGETRKAGRSLILLSAHGVQLGRGNYLPAAAAALAGFPVKTMIAFDGLEFDERFKGYIEKLTVHGGQIEIMNRGDHDVAAETMALLTHLNEGGAAHIAPDGIYTIGQKIAAPWLLRPMPMSIYATQLAVARNSATAFVYVTPQSNGQIVFDLEPLEMPPNMGTMPVRAAWLTQRLARTVRRVLAQSGTPVSMSALVEGGGRPAERPMLPLAEWGSTAGVQNTLCGWLAAAATDPDAIALKGPHEEVTFRSMRSHALSMAAMLLHFQSEKPAHTSPKRRFLQQHRVLAILPNGAAALATGLGAMAAGSLHCLCSDDLAPDVLAARIHAFKPDLILAGAAAWTNVLSANARLNRYSVLHLDDAGDTAAIKDLTDSFKPAEALPPITVGQPALAVFTSGSDGAPKCVVSANTLYSRFAGLDKLLLLQPGDRVVYLTRWDAIGLADLLSCLRSGAAVIAPEDGIARTPDAFVTWLKDMGASVLSMPASLWAGLAETPSWRMSPPPIRSGFFWGERIEQSAISLVAETLPGAGLFAAYGSSEAPYIGFGPLDPTAEPQPFSFGGAPVPGTELTLTSASSDEDADADDAADENLPNTVMNVTGPDVMIGYFDDLAAENAAIPETLKRSVRHSDRVRIAKNGQIQVFGRADSIIKIGGQRLSLMEVQAAAETVPDVRRAIAFAMKDGPRDRIAIALESKTDNPEAVKQAASSAIVEKLFPSARPARAAIMSAFPANAAGKLDRAAIRAEIDTAREIDVLTTSTEPKPPVQVENSRKFIDALEHWAVYNWMSPQGRFNPDAPPPELDSIDIMDLILLAEEVTGKTQTGAALSLDGSKSWRALADALAPGG